MKRRKIGLVCSVVLSVLFLFSLAQAQQWIIETVDSLEWGSAGAYNSLELDDNDNPHIAYYLGSGAPGVFKHAYWSSGDWNMDTVQTWVSHPHNSLELDSAGNPCIAYCYRSGSSSTKYLAYAQKESGEWNSVLVDTQTGSFGVEGVSLALDGSGYPHISYTGGTVPLRYVWKDETGWHREGVTVGQTGPNTSLKLDDTGYPHVTTGDNYCYKDPGGWHYEVFPHPPEDSNVRNCSMILDSAGFPHIAFYKRFYDHWTVEYAFKDAGGWYVENADSLGDYAPSGADISLQMDTNGISHVSYYNGHDDFMYAYRKEGRWHRSSVQYAGHSPGLYNSLDLSTLGYPYISYTCWSWNVENVTLRLAKANPSYCDVGVASIESPPDTVLGGSVHYPVAIINNYALFPVSFDVSCKIDSAGTTIYSDTVAIVDLEPDIALQVQFDPWTVPSIPDVASFTITAITLLDDNGPGNNSKSKIVFARESNPPVMLAAGAFDGANPAEGIDEDDFVLITFDESTNKPLINALNINDVLQLSGGHSWLDGFGQIDSTCWNPTGEMLLIELSVFPSPPTLAVGDTITLDGVTIKDTWGNPSSAQVVITGSFYVSVPTDANGIPLPAKFSLAQNYPNPFNPVTTIKYALPRDCYVELDVSNILGQKVATLVDGKERAGYKTVSWDAKGMVSGIYFFRLQAGDFVQTRRMVLLR